MNNNNIKKLLEELYIIDPQLKQHEANLLKLMETIIAAKPNIEINETFVANLKKQLLTQSGKSPVFNNLNYSFKNMIFKQYSKLIGTGLALAAIVVLPIITLSLINRQQSISFELSIEPAGKEAFGLLSQSTESSLQPMGLGGDSLSTKETALNLSDEPRSMILPPDFEIKYNYIFEGEIPELNTTIEVLRRVKNKTASQQAAAMLKNLKFDFINLPRFGPFNLQNLTLAQDRPFGYTINANLEEGSLLIHENWQQWPQSTCQDQNCFERERIRFEQIPEDNKILEIVNNFISQYNIDIKNYGQPEIIDDWRTNYLSASNKAEVYIPEAVSVVYPLKINGKTVYEEWGGGKNGLQINVNIRHQKVSSVNNLNSQTYESSQYPAVTDTEKIKAIIKQGGINNYQPENAKQVIDIKLGEPYLGYVKIWQYQNNASQELLVPALIFPITEKPQNQLLYRRFITIPLAKEIIDRQEGPIRIMPFEGRGSIEPDTGALDIFIQN